MRVGLAEGMHGGPAGSFLRHGARLALPLLPKHRPGLAQLEGRARHLLRLRLREVFPALGADGRGGSDGDESGGGPLAI